MTGDSVADEGAAGPASRGTGLDGPASIHITMFRGKREWITDAVA